MKRKRKENQIIEVLNQVMGKGGICIHYTPLVVSEGVTAGRDFDPLVCLVFLFRFRSCLSVFGGLLGERIRMSVSTPFCPSWDTILSLSFASAYRGTDKAPRRSERLYVLVCASACRLCVCVTEAMTSMSLCHPASNLSPQGGRLEAETTRSKTQTDPCP